MLTVVVSFFGTVFLFTLTLLFLNYSVYLWENKKILDLSSRIKPNNTPDSEAILGKGSSSHGFTSIDVGESISKQRTITPINADERKVLFADEEDLQPKWISQIITFFKRLRANFWVQSRNAFVYLIKLAGNSKETVQTEEEVEVISEVIEKVKDIDAEKEAEDEVESTDSESVSPSNQVVVIKAKEVDEDDSKETPTQKKRSEELFEKMEARLLDKLKEEGMKHFDIWLDLAKLYEDQDEPEKAKEIYQMVLKHADGKEQKKARNALYQNS